jgi:hypothetical protein
MDPAHCSKRLPTNIYIDNRLVLHKKNTLIATKGKTLVHRATKYSKNTKTANINKCTKVQKPNNAKMWQEQMHMEKHGLGFRVLL